MNEDLEKLRQIVFREEVLQNDLQAISDREEFISRVLEIGKQRDLNFTEEDILQAMNEQRRAWIERWI